MQASERLAAAGLELPKVPAPLASYVPAQRVADQVWTSGQLPTRDGELIARGKLGDAVSVEVGVEAAERAMLNAVAAAADVAGGLDRIKRVLRACVFVASTPEFTRQPEVANGASRFLQTVFGDAGVHVRSAVGVSVLPLDAPVEVELVVEV